MNGIEHTDTSISICVDVHARAGDLFAVLADPRRHVEIDGSDMLRGMDPTSPVPLTAFGEVFTMRMSHPARGEYRTDNHVVEIEHDRRISWATAREDAPPVGVWWTWILEPMDGQRTRITHRYDWSRVTDPAVLEKVRFPFVPAADLQASVERLVAAS